MPQQIKRLLLVFAVLIISFLIVRILLKPKSFGETGHFRQLAILENTEKPLKYAGRSKCNHCHESEREDFSYGYHEKMMCEVCHGPGLKHATYAGLFKNSKLPDSLVLFKPRERKYCAVCHDKNAGRIKITSDTIDNSMIKQVSIMEHHLIDQKTKAEFKCIDCHNPHLP